MNELERIRAAVEQYRKTKQDYQATIGQSDMAARKAQDTYWSAESTIAAIFADSVDKLLAVADAASSLPELSDRVLRLDGYESNVLCPYCEGNYIETYENNPFVHSADCPVIVLQTALAALTTDE